MKVILAKSAGFCTGVRKAVDTAIELADNSPGPIHTDGALIHNDQMIQELATKDIHVTDDPSSLSDGVLMIRAHGIPPARRHMLRQLPVRVVDATCPDVARIHGLIKKHVSKGYTAIIFGDPGHAEVVGLAGSAGKTSFVVTSVEDVASLPALQKVCLVSQTTQCPASYELISRSVLDRYPNTVVLDTICGCTKSRQDELRTISATVDAFVVVGGHHSANTMRLVSLAQALKPTYHIETAAQIRPADFTGFRTIGLTSGASTPDFVIDEIKTALEAI